MHEPITETLEIPETEIVAADCNCSCSTTGSDLNTIRADATSKSAYMSDFVTVNDPEGDN